jgi:hypothetical protein
MKLTIILSLLTVVPALAVAFPQKEAVDQGVKDCKECDQFFVDCKHVSHLDHHHEQICSERAQFDSLTLCQLWQCWVPGSNCDYTCRVDTCRHEDVSGEQFLIKMFGADARVVQGEMWMDFLLDYLA